jgi:glycosyltransferase involved in cell wall biosynthesis
MKMQPVALFYEEPEPDRWLPFDRYPRRVVRRLVRGKPQPGGVMRWFLNLRAGLDRLGVPYRVNDYRGLRRSPGAWAHVLGKPHVVEKIPAGHPIIYGPGVAAHPYESNFWGRADIRLMLISCAWFKAMYDRDLPRPVPTAVWPAGVDTDMWKPYDADHKTTDFLIYDKVRWEHDQYESSILQPIRDELKKRGLSFKEIRYGHYLEEEYRQLLPNVRAMIFLCEHETQGFAYLQALSCGAPIFAWDRGGFWQDPSMYPDRVQFAPVTSVPYFGPRCGVRFRDFAEFQALFPRFWEDVRNSRFQPREYVLENFDLAAQAQNYVELSVAAQACA